MRRFLCLLLLALVSVFLISGQPPALAGGDSRLDAFASKIAGHPVQVRCPSYEELVQDPYWFWGVLGYTRPQIDDSYMVVVPEVCAGALALGTGTVSLVDRAEGVLVLLHESYHLRRWSARLNEGKVECKAIRHVRVGARLLGASEQEANEIVLVALGLHQQMTYLFPSYDLASCKLPLWSP